jgi:molybdopterin-guanine dinucleotide biosynthesis protein
MRPKREKPLIGIVGVCASGKTTLIKKLSELGYDCRHIAQEHSYVKTMWKQMTNPDILVFLEVSYPQTIIRRKLNWTLSEYMDQHDRLSNARENADIVVNTDDLTSDQVCDVINTKLEALFCPK